MQHAHRYCSCLFFTAVIVLVNVGTIMQRYISNFAKQIILIRYENYSSVILNYQDSLPMHHNPFIKLRN
jgi:hypothetical protein